ncbi:hypothetical protein [Lachnoclostridium phytofermentans]|uniref:DZANK-type domain-containing protein n=1 Tax=Lachnoclostridium phytofermentans (strain ATCC 700394 / DSM 18823 / ISDg) TaxID=357809 RepID=A9KIE0_LACP7|nr:hypothetical protein [Lachnoclostridium phytofermentans]ABX42392.1 hypothetical protein Cphy_2024 [Lachnoclostridium phytofermentans ISDg]
MRRCEKCGELIGDSVTKCFNCGEITNFANKERTYRCRDCGEPLLRASDKCIKCGGDAESIRLWSEETPMQYESDSIGCLGYFVAILFTPLSCIIAILCYFSNGSEKAKKISIVSAITFLILAGLRILLSIILI